MASAAPSWDVTMIAPSRRLIAGMILALANFVVVLDLTIANVSVPHIAGDLGITLEQGAWIITSYAVAEAICVPLTGWLAQRFGAVRVFVTAMAGFGVFSMLCGMSVTLDMLVLARIGQGICGAPLMPMSQTLMLRAFPPEQRTSVMGIWAMTTLLGPALGPILGGMISDSLSWHWIFLINIPIAAGCAVAGFAILRPLETPTLKVPIDKMGLFLLVFWIGSLQIVLDIGREHDWFGDPLIVGLAISAVLGFIVFVIWELTEEHPIVNLRIFRNRGFSGGVFTMALTFGCYFASLVLIPQWLQTSLGYTATLAGVTTAFTAMTALPTTRIAARVITWGDPRAMVSGAVAWLGIMSLLRSAWTTDADFWTLAFPQILQGLGIAFFMIPLTTVTIQSVRPEEVASAAGLQNFLRTMAIAVATSLVLTIWGNGQRVSRSELVGSIHPDEAMRGMGDAGLSMEQSRQMISNMVEQEAVTLAMTHTFVLTACLLAAASLLVWISPRPKGFPSPEASGH